jgi:hypothetical protein
MDKAIEYALQRLRCYLSRGVNANEALMVAANEAQQKFGGSYSNIKQAIGFLQFGVGV